MREMNTLHTPKTLKDFENKVKDAFLQKKVHGPIHLSGGNEEQLIELFKDVNDNDWVFSTHRSHYHYLLKGGCERWLLMEIAKGRSMHIYDKSLKFFTSAIVGGILPIATGVALGIKKEGASEHVWVFIGDGATDSGRFFVSHRFSLVYELPVTFVIEDNTYSCDTPYLVRWPCTDYKEIKGMIRKYQYERLYPHTGCGQFVQF